MQSRFHSILESLANVAVGYCIAVASQIAIFPLFDIHVPARTNFIMGGFFTAISLVRSYALRRIFNRPAFNRQINRP